MSVFATADRGVDLATLKPRRYTLSGSKHSQCEYNLAIESSSFFTPSLGMISCEYRLK